MEKEPSSRGLTVGLSLLFGFAMASLRESVDGFALGAILGALCAQILFLRKRASVLSKQLRELRELSSSVHAASTAAHASRLTPAAQAEAVRAQVPPPASQRGERVEGMASAPPMTGQTFKAPREPEWTASPAAPHEPSTFDRAATGIMTWLKRGNPLARIGMVILFFGAAFLARYAADNSLLPIELRFIAIALGAFALLFMGWRLRDKRAVYAQLLQGGGIAGLYLTVFAATSLYQLLPIGLAFGLMVVIALAAAVIAVAQSALPLAVIGSAGGFLAPIFLGSGAGNHIALFSYYAVLNFGVFAVAWFRTWRVLNVLGFVFTFTITGLWRASGYESDELFSADFFLILFFLMYVSVSILNSVRQPPDLKGYVSASLVFGLPVVAFTLHASLIPHLQYALAFSAVALGAFYLLLGWLLFQTRRENFRLLVEAFAALGLIFASLAIPLAFDTRTTAAMWAVEGAGLLWLGVRQQRKLARVFGALLQAGAGLGYLAGLSALRSDLALLNSAYIGALMLGASGVFSGYWLYRNRNHQASYEAGAQQVFTLWGLAWWLLSGLKEVAQFLRDTTLGASLAFAALTVALLAWLAANRQWRLPRILALYLPTVVVIAALMYSQSIEHPFAQWGAAGWALIFVAQFALLRRSEAQEITGGEWLHAGASWLLALLIAWESSWQIAERTTGVWASLPWGLAPALLVAWFGRRALTPLWPLAKHADAYRVLGAVPLVVVTGVWIAVVNLTNRGDAAWLPYLPLLNPLDISVALCFAAVALWWTSLGAPQRESVRRLNDRVLTGTVAALIFLWLNAALLRSLHHHWGAPLNLYGIADSTLVQSALSIFWSVLGFTAMTIAAKQRWRCLWLVGAGLMLVVVAKLFLVDLSNVGTIARIASFLSVGALLLITGYLAPLPPREAAVEA